MISRKLNKSVLVLLSVLIFLSFCVQDVAADCFQVGSWVDCVDEARVSSVDPDSYKNEGGDIVETRDYIELFNIFLRGRCFNQEDNNYNFYDRCVDCTHVDECFVRGCPGCRDYSEYAEEYGMSAGANCRAEPGYQDYVCERGACKPPRQYGQSCTEGWDCQCESGCCMDVAAPPPPPPPPPECGDGNCDPGEDENSCPEDCAGQNGPQLSQGNGYGVGGDRISYQGIKICSRSEGDVCSSSDECCTKNNYGCYLSPITGNSHCCPDTLPYWNGAECKDIPPPVASITDVSTTWVNSDNISLSCSDAEGECNVTMYCVDLERVCYPRTGPPGGIGPPNCTYYPSTCDPDTVYSSPFEISFDDVIGTFGENVTSADYYVKYHSIDNSGNQETTKTSTRIWFWRFGGFASASSTPGSYETDVSSRIMFDSTAPTTTISYSTLSPTTLSYLYDGTLSVMCYHPVNQDPYPCNLTVTLECYGTSGADCNPTKWYYFDSDGTCSTSKSDYTSSTTDSSIIVNTDHNDWLCLWVEDIFGNFDTAVSSQLMVDATAPVASITGVSTAWVSSDDVTLSCTDAGGPGFNSGCKPVKWYYFDSDGTCSGNMSDYQYSVMDSGSITIDTNHNDWLCLWVEDEAGNYDTAVSSQLMVDVDTPATTINPDGGDFTGNNEVNFTLTCTDTGGSGCGTSYYKIIDNGQSCGTTGFTSGTSGSVTCPFGQACDKVVCFYSVDGAGNTETTQQSSVFHLETGPCINRVCGESCIGEPGICNGTDPNNCYTDGGCLLDCTVPGPGSGNQRVWENSDCGRTGSYKCGAQQVCSNSYTSCITDGSPTQVTGDWTSYTTPSGYFGVGDTFQITLNGISSSPGGFTILAECSIVKSDGSIIYFNNWGSGDLTFSYTIQSGDPGGTWTIDYCGLWSDFLANSGWSLKFDDNDYSFTVDKAPPTVSVGGAPANWQNTNATASVSCSDADSGCDANSYRLHISSTSISTCPTDYDNDYSSPGTQTISSHSWVCGAAKDNMGNEGFSSPVEFLIDKTNPVAFLDPLPAGTTQDTVIVGWNGSDTESGIDYFELQYRVTTTDGSEIQGWTDWTTSSSNPGTLPFSGMQNNRTYHFRVRAIDNTGNTGSWSSVESITVDTNPPTCQIDNLPFYTTSSSFNVSWSGYDEESGIQYYNVQVRVGAGSWGYLNDPDGYHTTATSDNVNGADGNTYFFRCNATDVAGNEGPWSPVVNTTVDATPPVSSVDPLPPWLNVTNFTVSWLGFDQASGIDCYYVQWSDDNVTWSDWFTCTADTSGVFGPDYPTNVTENSTYYFRSRAIDMAGNIEGWPPQPDTYTTIDLTPPQYDLHAYDDDGREIGGFVPPGTVSSIILRSTTTDSISGVEHNYIEYLTVLLVEGERFDFDDCGSASPYGGVSECDANIDFSGVVMIDFWVKVIDRAGNVNVSNVSHITTHPLANFVKHNLHLIVGDSITLKVYIRNMQDEVDNVTVNISSGLPVDPYFVVMESLAWINNTWVGEDLELKGNNRTIVVKNLNPESQRSFIIQVWSTEPDIYHMFLDAYSELNINLTDTDQALIKISWPASFPGLSEWAILVLIILAVLGYVWFGKEMR